MKSYLNKPVAAIAVLFTLFLSACSTFQPSSNAPLPKDIKQLDSWTVRGKILIKTATDKESGYLKVDRPQKYSNKIPCLYGFLPQTYSGELIADNSSFS